MNTFWTVLEPAIGAATGQPFALRRREPVGGGCIHQAWRVSDGDRTYFVKVNDGAHLPLFEAEAAGLAELAATATVRVPTPLHHGIAAGHAYLVLEYLPLGGGAAGAMERLGRQLAALHRQLQAGFGWRRDNFIGTTPQPNPPARAGSHFGASSGWGTNWRGPPATAMEARGCAGVKLYAPGWRACSRATSPSRPCCTAISGAATPAVPGTASR